MLMANNIKQLLAARKMSVYRLAKETGLTYPTASKLVKAVEIPADTRYDTLRRIADALGVGVEELED